MPTEGSPETRAEARKRRVWQVVIALPIALSLLALQPARALADVAECDGLGSALTEHSCFHAVLGPFNTVLSTVGPTPTSTTPNIDAVHTEHRVALAEPAGHNVVIYSPVRSGQWIVFLGSDVPLAVYDPGGQAIPAIRSDRGTTGCDALPIVHAFQFAAEETYRFVLGPSAAREVVVVVEYAEDFLLSHGRDHDGDSWGDPTDITTFTVCSAAEGYSEKLGDCDDNDAGIHPGAHETCDDVDRNCNGLANDVGLQCGNGLGACRSSGTFTCEGVPEGDPVLCGAIPEVPSREECNGADDDCNGDIDDGADLCVDPHAPTCVRHGDGAFCGCLVDLDCGDLTSGRVCDPSTRICKDGCSTVPGGNGCPDGLVCARGDSGVVECTLPDVIEPEPEPEPEEPLRDQGGGCSCKMGGGAARLSSGQGLLLTVLGALWCMRRRRAKTFALERRIVLASAALLHVSCGGKTIDQRDEPAPNPGLEDPCVPLLSEAPAKHACSHGTHGPFTSVVAASNPEAAPAVDRVHIPYQVEFADGAEGWLSYRSSREGQHVVFTDSTVEVTVTAESVSGSEPPNSVERSDSCKVFSQAQVVENLQKGTSYRIFIRQLDNFGEPVLFFVEHLGTFGTGAFLEACE